MKKRKIRFNIVDVIIILILIALAFALYSAVSGRKTAQAENHVTLRCVFRTDAVPAGLEANFRVGDALFLDGGKVRLGTVFSAEVRPAVHTGVDRETGEAVFSDIDGKYTVYVTVETDAEKDGSSYFTDGYEIYVGKTLDAVTPMIAFGCECISIETVSD